MPQIKQQESFGIDRFSNISISKTSMFHSRSPNLAKLDTLLNSVERHENGFSLPIDVVGQ